MTGRVERDTAKQALTADAEIVKEALFFIPVKRVGPKDAGKASRALAALDRLVAALEAAEAQVVGVELYDEKMAEIHNANYRVLRERAEAAERERDEANEGITEQAIKKLAALDRAEEAEARLVAAEGALREIAWCDCPCVLHRGHSSPHENAVGVMWAIRASDRVRADLDSSTVERADKTEAALSEEQR